MADQKISGFSDGSPAALSDLLVIERGVSNFKLTLAELLTGAELDYVEKTSNTTVTATTDGNSNGTAIIDGNAVTYDGSTRIKLEVWFPVLEINEPNVGHINLYDGTTDLGRLILVGVGAGTGTIDFAVYGVRFLTPSAAAHTYHIRGWKSGGTFTAGAGAGGASTNMPAWYRITKA